MKQIREQIEKIEERLFYLDMIDNWNSEIRNLVDKLTEELKTLKSQLA